MTEWYVIDTRRKQIVNCITTSGAKPSLDGFTDAKHMTLDPNPPMEMLKRYRYWDERP